MSKIKLILRKVVTVVIFLTGSLTVFGQDIIIMKNGNDIQAVVQEVGIDEVKYKRFDNPNGPNYTLKKSDVFMIRYENGTKDVFNVVNTTPVESQREMQTTNNQQVNSYNEQGDFQEPVYQYPALKYTFGKEISPYGSEKSPFLAGFLSLLVPGVGQFYNGDIGGGFLFLGANIICNSIWMSSISTDYYGSSSIENENAFVLGFLGAIAVNIVSVVNAAKVAKKVNIVRGYRLGENTFLKVQPAIIPKSHFTANKEYAYGLNFCLNF